MSPITAWNGNTTLQVRAVCNLYSITTKQEAIARLFLVMNRYVGNLPPIPGVFPDYPAPVVRNALAERELTLMRWGMLCRTSQASMIVAGPALPPGSLAYDIRHRQQGLQRVALGTTGRNDVGCTA